MLILCLGILVLGHQVLRVSWQATVAARWGLLAGLGMGYALWLLWQDLPLNRRFGEEHLLPDFGPGTLLTISRGVLVAVLTGFLVIPRPTGNLVWVPAGLYWLANLTDFFDGYLARRTNRVTYLGEALDIKLDGFGVLVATVLIVLYGQVPFWYLLVGLARYFFVAGIWVLEKMGKPVSELPPSVRRRAFAGVQMGFVGAMLMPIFGPPGTYWAAAVFGLLFLLGFLVDWLYVSRVLEPANLERYAKTWDRFRGGFTILVRLAAVLSLSYLVYQQLTAVSPEFGFFFWLETVLLLVFLVGVAGRISAVVALVSLGIYQLSSPLSGPQMLLVVAAALLFFLGTGPHSLWTPENLLIDWRPGERS